MENKQNIVTRLKSLLNVTRAGVDITDLTLNEAQDKVTIHFINRCCKEVDIAGDSGIAIIKDVISKLQ